MTCITDPYGNPYVPGSSLKGMLRTILLSRDILQNREKYRTDTRQLRSLEVNRINRRILNNNIVKIEKNAFNSVRSSGKETVDFDIMSGIIVGDSEPLSREDIILCQKWEQHTDGTYKTLNLLRECIKPGTVIKSTLTIDETLCNIKKEDILEAVQLFYEQYYQNFQKKFSRSDRRKPNTVFLGGGSGFVSKTVIYPLFGEKEGIETVKNIFDRTNIA
ncbi:MAG: type III-A CRISPR-associated RAMP protein Csm5 [Blautia wexlerae]